MERETHRYLRLWREKRGLTQDQVVDRLVIHEDEKLPRSKAQLSKIENGKSPYNQRILEALGDIYDCKVWELVGRDPTKEGEVLDMMRPLDERMRQRVAAYIAGLTEGAQAK